MGEHSERVMAEGSANPESAVKPARVSDALSEYLEVIFGQESRTELRASVLPSLLSAIAKIAETLRNSHDVSLAGSANTLGDDQLNVDLLAENHIRDALSDCQAVKTASSEEDPVEREVLHSKDVMDQSQNLSPERYTVAFDPLDGSSIIASNWTVGAIFGIWDGVTALGQNPREKQLVSIMGVLGPRTTAFIALRLPGEPQRCLEVGLEGGEWKLLRNDVQLSKPPFKTRYFAPANLRSAAESPAYMDLITTFIKEAYSLRYIAGLVPDIAHALVKGHGVYVNPVTAANKPKLRRLYELCPIALIVECAGGVAKDLPDGVGILDHVLESTDERAGWIAGTAEEVEKALGILH